MSLEQLEEFGFGAADLIFYVPGLHSLGERDHHFRQKVYGLQMATGRLVYQLCEAGLKLGHSLQTIFSLGQDFLFRNLSQQFWDSLGFSRSPTGVARTPFLELKCFGWFFITSLIFNIMRHASPPLDRSTRRWPRTPPFRRCVFPISSPRHRRIRDQSQSRSKPGPPSPPRERLSQHQRSCPERYRHVRNNRESHRQSWQPASPLGAGLADCLHFPNSTTYSCRDSAKHWCDCVQIAQAEHCCDEALFPF